MKDLQDPTRILGGQLGSWEDNSDLGRTETSTDAMAHETIGDPVTCGPLLPCAHGLEDDELTAFLLS